MSAGATADGDDDLRWRTHRRASDEGKTRDEHDARGEHRGGREGRRLPERESDEHRDSAHEGEAVQALGHGVMVAQHGVRAREVSVNRVKA